MLSHRIANYTFSAPSFKDEFCRRANTYNDRWRVFVYMYGNGLFKYNYTGWRYGSGCQLDTLI